MIRKWITASLNGRSGSGETANSSRLIVKNFKDGVKFRDLQKILNAFGQIQEFKLTTLICHAREPGNHLAYARAVDVCDISKVQ